MDLKRYGVDLSGVPCNALAEAPGQCRNPRLLVKTALEPVGESDSPCPSSVQNLHTKYVSFLSLRSYSSTDWALSSVADISKFSYISGGLKAVVNEE